MPRVYVNRRGVGVSSGGLVGLFVMTMVGALWLSLFALVLGGMLLGSLVALGGMGVEQFRARGGRRAYTGTFDALLYLIWRKALRLPPHRSKARPARVSVSSGS